MPIPTPTSASSSSSSVPPVNRETEKRLKLQNFLVLKAFNLRKGKQTLVEQFQFLRRVDPVSGRGVLALDTLCEYLAIPPFRRLILCQVFQLSTSAATIDFDAFVRFLQTAAVQAAQEERELYKQSASSLPLPPPPSSLHGNQQLVCFEPSLLSMRFARPPPVPGLWKKREITIQERITEYTKIDETGRAQHLVESEKHQSEVVHMESLTGEFAHREITQFETLERLNDEVVNHESGREEFVHLKSQHDEVSKFESSIPTSQGPPRPEECEQPPPSPTIKRDPSAMDGSTGFQSPGRANVVFSSPEEEEEYYRYQSQFAQSAAGDGAEMETLLEEAHEYPMEPPPE